MVVVGTLLVAASPTAGLAGETIDVGPGESIQEAVDGAGPGAVIRVAAGVYRESVEIQKSNLTLLGAGPSRGGTILLPPPQPADTACSHGDHPSDVGFCIAGGDETESYRGAAPVTAIMISGFLFRHFSGMGIMAVNASGLTFTRNAFDRTGEYGIGAFGVSGITISDSAAHHAGVAGFYVGESVQANATIRDSVSIGSDLGFFIRDASVGTISNVVAKRNCMGVLFLSIGQVTGDWTIQGSLVQENRKSCAGGEGPPVSGTGIALAGTDGVHVLRNTVRLNVPSAPALFSGGVVVFSTEPFGGSAPSDNRVERNRIHLNAPADIVWDGSGADNEFVDNNCETSAPPDLCDR